MKQGWGGSSSVGGDGDAAELARRAAGLSRSAAPDAGLTDEAGIAD